MPANNDTIFQLFIFSSTFFCTVNQHVLLNHEKEGIIYMTKISIFFPNSFCVFVTCKSMQLTPFQCQHFVFVKRLYWIKKIDIINQQAGKVAFEHDFFYSHIIIFWHHYRREMNFFRKEGWRVTLNLNIKMNNEK